MSFTKKGKIKGAVLKQENTELKGRVNKLQSRVAELERSKENIQERVDDLEKQKEWVNNIQEVKKVEVKSNKTNENVSVKLSEANHNGKSKIRKLKILGDSMLKHISVKKLLPDCKDSENLCKPGATVEKLMDQLSATRKKVNVNDGYVTDVVVHIGSNNLPRDSPTTLINKLAKVLHMAQQTYVNAKVYFSPIIPKYNNTNILR